MAHLPNHIFNVLAHFQEAFYYEAEGQMRHMEEQQRAERL